jgi:glycosyltransferase involved in cell wall biosynthesis
MKAVTVSRAERGGSVNRAPRPLRIGLVGDGIGDVVAGSFISTSRFGELLSSRGHSVTFVSSGSPRNVRERAYRGMKMYRFLGVPVPWSDGQLYLALPSRRRVRQILVDERLDLIHVTIPLPLGLIAVRVAKAMGLPIVMHSHTQPQNIFMNSFPLPGQAALTHRFFRYLNWIYRQADMMIYPSAFSRRQFPELGTLPNTVISNGVDVERFRPTCPDAFMHRFGLSKDKQHLMYLGRLHGEKDVETLIRAMPAVLTRRPAAHLFIVGLGYERPKLERIARDLAVVPHITFCGYVPDDELAAAYSACSLFVLPSLAELEGMAVLEAMACGKPILVADSVDSAARELVVDNGLLFRARDPEDLARQADRVLSDPERLRAMAEASLRISGVFDIQASAAALETVYYSVVP